jgi:molybdate transport system ATP-binding protein
MIHIRLRKRAAATGGQTAFVLEIDFQAEEGITVLFGPAEAGTSLTLNCVAGFEGADEGRILVNDDILFDAASGLSLPPQQRRCGWISCAHSLFPHMSLRENLMFAAPRRRALERNRTVKETMELFGLIEFADRKPGEVSEGVRRRGMIARGVLMGPRVLLIEEPGHDLGIPVRHEVYQCIRQAKSKLGVPALLRTGDLDEAFLLGDEMLVFEGGRILQQGAPRDIVDAPASLEVARLLGLHNLIQAEIRTLNPSSNQSELRFDQHTLRGPYFPGRLRGDHVWLYVRPDELSAMPRNGAAPASNQLAVSLQRAVERPEFVELSFSGNLVVHMRRHEFQPNRDNKEWLIEFPPQALRIL